jgi:hypothetical protein
MPALPRPARRQGEQMSYDGRNKVHFDCYDSDQMHAYAQAYAAQQVREVLEQALELCQVERAERLEASEGPEGRLSDMAFGSVRAAERIAEKLGALAAEIQPPQKADTD